MDGEDDDRALIRAWQQDGDAAARGTLVLRTMPLVQSLARRYAGRGEPLEDLEQVACLGLLKAIDRFDLEREVQFSTYAVPTIAGEIKRHFRDRGWMVRPPREVQELGLRLSVTRDQLTSAAGRTPTVAEVAAAAGTCPAQAEEALRAGSAYRAVSLDEPLAGGLHAHEALGGDDEELERTEQRLLLGRGLAHLPAREREILRLRYYEGLTQREIATEVGLSQMHVSRLLRRSVDALREALAPRAAAA